MRHGIIHVAHTCEREVKENTHHHAAGEQSARRNEHSGAEVAGQGSIGSFPGVALRIRTQSEKAPLVSNHGRVKAAHSKTEASPTDARLLGKEGVRLRGASTSTPQLARLFSSDANDGELRGGQAGGESEAIELRSPGGWRLSSHFLPARRKKKVSLSLCARGLT